jgi:hypothetical protein
MRAIPRFTTFRESADLDGQFLQLVAGQNLMRLLSAGARMDLPKWRFDNFGRILRRSTAYPKWLGPFEPMLGFFFYYYSQLEDSHEDGNSIRWSSYGPEDRHQLQFLAGCPRTRHFSALVAPLRIVLLGAGNAMAQVTAHNLDFEFTGNFENLTG